MRTSEQFIADLRLVQESLRSHRGARLADGRLGDLLMRQAEVFGFHLATLDIRQHAERHTAALAEIFERYGMADDYAAWPEERKVAFLTAELLNPRPLTPARLDFSEETNEMLEVFRLIRQAHERMGAQADRKLHHQHDHAPSDVLGVSVAGQRCRIWPPPWTSCPSSRPSPICHRRRRSWSSSSPTRPIPRICDRGDRRNRS